jgi:N-acetylmuramoyl-L-alanine amidase/peptidoglycan L-alanyl-D-glutamate endopeptidase CwlK
VEIVLRISCPSYYKVASDNFDPLPAQRLCNSSPPFNPIKGEGPLGNESTGKMFFHGKDKKELVTRVQTALLELGKNLGPAGIDGIFGNATEKALKSFQEENMDFEGNPLAVDGLVGPETSDALNRAMVGRHFDVYQTPKEITDGKLIVTATLKAAKEGIRLDLSEIQSIKFLLVDFNLFKIALFDADGERFSQFEEAKYEVVDEDDKVLAEGNVKPQEDITVATTARPTKARLNVGSVIYEFPLNQAI